MFLSKGLKGVTPGATLLSACWIVEQRLKPSVPHIFHFSNFVKPIVPIIMHHFTLMIVQVCRGLIKSSTLNSFIFLHTVASLFVCVSESNSRRWDGLEVSHVWPLCMTAGFLTFRTGFKLFHTARHFTEFGANTITRTRITLHTIFDTVYNNHWPLNIF